jgi:phosphotransferase system enzyme I (PtsI)
VSVLAGIAASPGSCVAAAFRHDPAALELPTGTVADPAVEASALEAALEAIAGELDARAAEASGPLAEVLSAQALMARDPDLLGGAREMVAAGTPAARAVVDAGERYAAVLAASDSEYLAARAEDVRDVVRRTARALIGAADDGLPVLAEPAVVVARDIAPADVAELDLSLVRGIVTEEGSRTSHTTIVARALGVPAVVGVPGLLSAVRDGESVGVDGDRGVVHVDPDPDEAAALDGRARAAAERRARLERLLADAHHGTRDGHVVECAANVGSAAEVQAAVGAGADGVGLFRTELLYLDRTTAPTRDEQEREFGAALAALGDRPLVVRTFDFGADKPVAFLTTSPSPNPALGVRGLRLARVHPELLDDQIAALAGATRAAGRRAALMAPMVTTVEDAAWFGERVRAVAGDGVLEIGAMVEVPSAVLLADELTAVLDFVSIGTNDLGQYLHAADRQEGALAELQDPFSPALLRAVERVADAGRRHDAWVGVCGEAAGDPLWAAVAAGLGVTELSMGAGALLEVRAALAQVALEDCKTAALRALAAGDAAAARAAAADVLGEALR